MWLEWAEMILNCHVYTRLQAVYQMGDNPSKNNNYELISNGFGPVPIQFKKLMLCKMGWISLQTI